MISILVLFISFDLVLLAMNSIWNDLVVLAPLLLVMWTHTFGVVDVDSVEAILSVLALTVVLLVEPFGATDRPCLQLRSLDALV